MNRFSFGSALRSRHQKLPNSDCGDDPSAPPNKAKTFRPTLALVRNASVTTVTSGGCSSSSTVSEALLSRMVNAPVQSSYEVTPPRRSLQKGDSSTSLSFRRASSSYTVSTDPDSSSSSTLSDGDEALVEAKGGTTLLVVPTNLTVNTYEVTPPKRYHLANTCTDRFHANIASSCTVRVPVAERRHSMPSRPSTSPIPSASKLRIARAMGRRPSQCTGLISNESRQGDSNDDKNDDQDMKYPYCVLSGPRPLGSSQNWWARKHRRQRIQEILTNYKADVNEKHASTIEQSIQCLLDGNGRANDGSSYEAGEDDSSCEFSLQETFLFASTSVVRGTPTKYE